MTDPPPPAFVLKLDDLSDGDVMSFQRLEPGSFRMGMRGEQASAEPIHTVRITRPPHLNKSDPAFFLGTYAVTQAQFEVWTRAAGITHENGFPNKPNHPAENMDLNQATKFCEWINDTYGSKLPTGFEAALPTEAQWEYACRAGTDTEYHTGDGEAALADAGWFDENSGYETHPVGKKQHNELGLFDMHGNVWEWCRDAWDERAYQRRVDGTTDPEVKPKDVRSKNPGRVVRGGSWGFGAGVCRAAVRDGWTAGGRFGVLGFRVALVPRSCGQSVR